MKIIYVLPVFILLIPLLLQGQSGRNEDGITSKKITDVLTEKCLRHPPSVNDSVLNKPFCFSDSLFKRRPGMDKDDFIFRYPGKRFYPHPDLPEEAEIYPGAPKFYGKSPLMPSPYQKSFIIPHIPSRNRKYFLIIKDPITHRIIN